MSKKRKIHAGSIDWIASEQIYLNIQHLKDGLYTLKIVNKNKIIKEVIFKKTTIKL
jgi:hypothetical protein